MAPMINPFDAGGYTLAEMTQAINILPNVYTRLGELGLFRFEGITQRSVIIEQAEGVLNLLPTVPLGGPATVANRDTRSMRSFTVPWIPHDDVITPQDIQGVRGFGVADAADPLYKTLDDGQKRRLAILTHMEGRLGGGWRHRGFEHGMMGGDRDGDRDHGPGMGHMDHDDRDSGRL